MPRCLPAKDAAAPATVSKVTVEWRRVSRDDAARGSLEVYGQSHGRGRNGRDRYGARWVPVAISRDQNDAVRNDAGGERTVGPGTSQPLDDVLSAVSNAMVRLHKEQFARGPARVRSHFAGPDMIVCALAEVLLPAELKMVELGDAERVRETRVAFQAATESEFIAEAERLLGRTVRAFASGVDPNRNVVFESFFFEPGGSGDGDARPST